MPNENFLVLLSVVFKNKALTRNRKCFVLILPAQTSRIIGFGSLGNGIGFVPQGVEREQVSSTSQTSGIRAPSYRGATPLPFATLPYGVHSSIFARRVSRRGLCGNA